MDKKNLIKYIIVGIASYIMGLFSNDLIEKLDLNNNYLTFESKNQEETFDVIQVDNLEMERGFLYTGSLRNNRRYGQGRMITPKGTIYEGEWLGNQIIEGTMLTDKSEYDGQFKNLSPDGYGTMRYKNGSFYRGMWKAGAKSGIGLFIDSIGGKSFGLWSKGLIDKTTMNSRVDNISYGIDLSHHNKITDWGNMALYMKQDGFVHTSIPKIDYYFSPIDFVFLKATEGATHRDKNYLSNMMNAKKYHKKRGSYHFMHLTSSSVEEQVENFLDYIVYEEGDLPPVLDIEVTKQAESIGIDSTRQKVLKWLALVEKRLGIKPIVYTSANFKRDYLSSSEFDNYDFWIAHYNNTEPNCKGYKYWQFTDKGKIHGNNSGMYDINIRKM